MLKIRLKRIGKKKQPSYRFVIAEATKPRDSKTIEEIGHYNPMTKPSTIKIDKDRAKHWMKHGAQPTDTVAQIFVKEKLIKEIKRGSKKSKGREKKKQDKTEK